MGKYTDIFKKYNAMDPDEVDKLDWENIPTPSFKGKVIGDWDKDNISIYEAAKDPDFKKAFDEMTDEERDAMMWHFVFAQPDMFGEEGIPGVIAKLDEGYDEEQPEDKPHDTELAGDTTLEEELMLNPDMSPEEFSKIAAKKRGAKKGEPAPDMNLGNVLSDSTQKNIIRTLSAHRW